MRHELRLKTVVQPGRRIELMVPELADGEMVEVTVRSAEGEPAVGRGICDFLQSLPVGPRSYPTWAEFESGFQKERDAWER